MLPYSGRLAPRCRRVDNSPRNNFIKAERDCRKTIFQVISFALKMAWSREQNYSREQLMLSIFKKSRCTKFSYAGFRGQISPDLLSCCRHRIAFFKVHNLFNIVNQAVKHPLDVDLDMLPQRKPIHSFT